VKFHLISFLKFIERIFNMLKNKLIVASLLVLGMSSANAFAPNDCTRDAGKAQGNGKSGLVAYCLDLTGPQSAEAIDFGMGFAEKHKCGTPEANKKKCKVAYSMIGEGVIEIEKVNPAVVKAMTDAGNNVVAG
jgi:hypothetical protein